MTRRLNDTPGLGRYETLPQEGQCPSGVSDPQGMAFRVPRYGRWISVSVPWALYALQLDIVLLLRLFG